MRLSSARSQRTGNKQREGRCKKLQRQAGKKKAYNICGLTNFAVQFVPVSQRGNIVLFVVVNRHSLLSFLCFKHSLFSCYEKKSHRPPFVHLPSPSTPSCSSRFSRKVVSFLHKGSEVTRRRKEGQENDRQLTPTFLLVPMQQECGAASPA
jgi:hypothetical protein